MGFKSDTNAKCISGYICLHPCICMSVCMPVIMACAKWYTHFMYLTLLYILQLTLGGVTIMGASRGLTGKISISYHPFGSFCSWDVLRGVCLWSAILVIVYIKTVIHCKYVIHVLMYVFLLQLQLFDLGLDWIWVINVFGSIWLVVLYDYVVKSILIIIIICKCPVLL